VQKAVEKPRLGVRRKVLVSAEPIAATKAVARFGKKKHLPPFAHQRVRRIEIDYFKAIEHLALDLPDAPNAEEGPAVLLLGENACGKSTILEATALALLGTDEIAKLRLDAAEFIHRRTWDAPIDDAEPARVSVYFTDADTPITLTVDPKKKRFAGARKPATVLLGYGPRRFFADGSRRKPRDEPAEQLRTMFDPLAVIENPTRWLMDAPQGDFDAAVRALRPILLLADEAVVARPPEGHRRGKQIMLEVQGDVAPLNRLSEGYKTIVATGVDVMREMLEYWPDLESARGVVLIDELETHLHPRWKMRIVQRLRRAMPRVQFIATTHDPLCLRGLYDGEAQVLQRDDERRIERLVELPNVRGLSVEQLLTSEFFGLFSTEDPTLEDDVARYAALVAKPNRSEIEDRTLDEQRETVQTTMTVGAKPADQLLNQATNEYLLQRRQAAAAQRPALKRAAIDRVVDIWKSLDT
jgi:energy-coupling factor transporter ATP-binding protein EcfA2